MGRDAVDSGSGSAEEMAKKKDDRQRTNKNICILLECADNACDNI